MLPETLRSVCVIFLVAVEGDSCVTSTLSREK